MNKTVTMDRDLFARILDMAEAGLDAKAVPAEAREQGERDLMEGLRAFVGRPSREVRKSPALRLIRGRR